MLAIALPNVAWQAANHFPMWELLRNGQSGKNIIAGPLLYMVQQILIMNLFIFPVWLIGFVWLVRKPAFRFLGFAYAIIILEMIVLHGKHYYPANIYPILLAAGAVQIEIWTSASIVARIAVMSYTLVLGPAFVPFSLPSLPEPAFLAYQDRVNAIMHVNNALATEHGRETTPLPGDWADMHGWPEMAAAIKRVYDALPPQDRAQAVVVTQNYGEASAVEFFTPEIPVISGHNQFWLWGTRGYSGNVIIDFDGDCGAKEHLFEHATRAATFNAPYTIGWETNDPIMVCRGIKVPLTTLWPSLKSYM